MKLSTTLLLVLVGGLAVGAVWMALQPPPSTKVVTSKVERLARLRSLVTASGEIRAKEFVDIQAEVTGVIQDLKVREGDSVKAGDELLRLEDLQLKAEEASAVAQVGASEADVQNSEVGVQTAEASLAAEHNALANARIEKEQSQTSAERAKASFARKQELHQKGLIGSEEFEISAAEARLAEQRLQFATARITQAEAGVKVAETRVAAAQAGLAASKQRLASVRASLARATDMASKTVLRAPLSGLITKLNVEKGERAVPGIQSNPVATLMTIADMSVIEAEIRVAEADIVEVAIGAPAEVEVEAMRDVKLVGKVTEIGQSPIQEATASSSSQNQQSKEFKVVVRLIDPPPSLRPGFTANARITTAERSDVLVVPFQAQTARELEFDDKGAYVPPPEPKEGEKERVLTAAERQRRKETKGVFVRRDGRARFLPVTFGVIGETQDVEVLAGLTEGDEVITGPNAALRTLKEWDRVELDEKRMGAALAPVER
ncbi:MAG: HlyD family secretion protein [Planctomycetota bacterium]